MEGYQIEPPDATRRITLRVGYIPSGVFLSEKLAKSIKTRSLEKESAWTQSVARGSEWFFEKEFHHANCNKSNCRDFIRPTGGCISC